MSVLSSILNHYYFKKKDVKMKRILVPTDFSPAAKNAYLYAKELSKKWGGKLEVVYCWTPILGTATPAATAAPADMTTLWQKELDNFSDAVGHPKSEAKLLPGFATEQIVDLSNEYDLVVMGTMGEHGALDQLFGSISSHVSREANCPVLLIPSDSKYGDGIHKMQYGVNYDGTEETKVRQIINFARHFDAEIHFVHVKTSDEDREGMLIEDTLFADLFEQGTKGVRVQLITIENDDAMEGLHQYAADNEMDLSVIATHERTWWEKLISSSTTKEMVFNVDRPLLVLHLD